MTDDEYRERERQDRERNEALAREDEERRAAARLPAGEPKMYRNTDEGGSRDFDRLYPKDKHRREILRRMAAQGGQNYLSLCSFGQKGGAAVSAGLLTSLVRHGFATRVGTPFRYYITDKGRSVIGG